jgi:hypothetical protein
MRSIVSRAIHAQSAWYQLKADNAFILTVLHGARLFPAR